jgi:hypothetical protein
MSKPDKSVEVTVELVPYLHMVWENPEWPPAN